MQYHSMKMLCKKAMAFLLAAAMILPNMGDVSSAATVSADDFGKVSAEGVDGVIEISTAQELAKIGLDVSYPMSGDYKLTADIDLSDMDWVPLGGYMGKKGTMNTLEANVFSGTFDGDGHVISGLTIDLDGSITGTDVYGQVGLFSVIAGDSAADAAQVKNLIFTDVDIYTDFSYGLATIGTLAGEVNGYANISNVAVVSGKLVINPTEQCDTVGAGGVIGECRTNDSIGNANVYISDCYNGADITAAGSRSDLIYAGGVIGRIAKSACGGVTRCVNVGSVQYQGYDGYGVAAAESSNAAYMSTVTDCYYLDNGAMAIGSGVTALSQSDLTSGTLPSGLNDDWSAAANCYPVPKIVYASSAAGYIRLAEIVLEFAEGESAAGMKTEVSLPAKLGDSDITWTSSNTEVLAVVDGKAVADTMAIGMDTAVTLTATTTEGYTRNFKIIVLTENEQKAVFDQAYAKVGEPLTVTVNNAGDLSFTYLWKVNGTTISNDTNTYTPTEADLEKIITVRVTATDGSVYWDLQMYCSELPVIYVDTNDGNAVTNNKVAKDAYIKVQGNEEFHDSKTLYEGATTIKGRGNSTWSWAVSNNVKKPYKLKLSSKSNLLGIGGGKNKHWVLLANAIDHTNMRNEIVNNFSRDIGMEHAMGTTSVVLILNGEYQGVYELAEHVRIGSSRVDVFDWEDLADDIAAAICNANPALNLDAMEEAMEQDYSWMSGSFTFGGSTYTISDYYTDPIPDFTGGFLLDMDFRSISDDYKYISTFRTAQGDIPMLFRSPEYAKTNSDMVDYAKGYLDAYEAAIRSNDFTTTYNGDEVHYTDLFDMDSLVQYWWVCEYTNNWDSMKNSTYLYKDLTGKAKMGPAWDYDWAFGNINMYSNRGPFVYDNWHTTLDTISTGAGGFKEQWYQDKQWNIYLVKDPYFVTKAYEYYQKYRPTVMEDIIKEGGTIDTLEAKYQKASEANDAKWAYSYNRYSGWAFVNGTKVSTNSQTYNDAIASMKTFIEKRTEWLDQQFTSVNDLYASLGNTVSNKVSVSTKESDGVVTATATVSDANAKYVEFVVNGKSVAAADGTKFVPVVDNKAEVVLSADTLESGDGVLNTVMVLGVNSANGYISGEMNFANFGIDGNGGTEPDTPDVVNVQKVTLSVAKKSLQVFDTFSLSATVLPANATQKTVIWTSSNPGVATVTQSGQITAKMAGTTVITATAADGSGIKATCVVTVAKPSLQVKGKTSVKRKKSITLTVQPLGVKGKVSVKLDSKSKKLAKVKVTGNKVKLTAKTKKGTVKMTIKCGNVTVTKKVKIK